MIVQKEQHIFFVLWIYFLARWQFGVTSNIIILFDCLFLFFRTFPYIHMQRHLVINLFTTVMFKIIHIIIKNPSITGEK